MSLSTLINRPCILIRRSASSDVDEMGNEVPGETLVETVCEIQQESRVEPTAEGQVSVTQWVGFFLPGTAIGTGDAVIVGDDEFEVEGGPWPTRNPRTRELWQIETTLKRVAGAEDAAS